MQYLITNQYSEMMQYPITHQYSEILQYPIANTTVTRVGLVWFSLVMVFNATFNTISVISWWSALLVEESGEKYIA
jgi:hypothetical protein